MTPPAPPQFSPDGKWWWTGAEWVPAEKAPQPPSPPQDRTPSSAQTGAAETKGSTDAGLKRRLVVKWSPNLSDFGGEVLVEGRDVICVAYAGLGMKWECRCPLDIARIHKTKRTWRIAWPEGNPRVKLPSLYPRRHANGITVRGTDSEAGMQWLLEYQSRVKAEIKREEEQRLREQESRARAELQRAVLDVSNGKEVDKHFPATGLGARTIVSIERGYLKLNTREASVPVYMVEFAGTEGTSESEIYLNLFGAGTRLGQVRGNGEAIRNAADWINGLVKGLAGLQQQAIQEARQQQVPLVKCLYCGTRVQDVGRCIQCGAPLPQP